jgi:hypothetical protein
MTLGSLWQLFARKTKGWMVGGTAAVLAGVALGFAPALGFPDGNDKNLELLLPSLFLSLGGGYAVLFPGVQAGGSDVHLLRDWKLLPRCGRFLWILSLAAGTLGLLGCILAAVTHAALPGALVWLFMGPYLALTGWAAGLVGVADKARRTPGAEALVALAPQPC